MTGKADFTEQEWELVREGPTAAGMYALMASKGGSFRESWALSKTYAEARQERGESELLDSIVAEKPPVKRYDSAEQLEHEGLAEGRPGLGTFVTRTLADTSLAAHKNLRADLVRWMTKARRAGLDDESIAALFESTFRAASEDGAA